MPDGLRFRKLDLHVHTGASYDFYGNVTPKDIVETAIRNGLDGLAVTDHNTADWIDKIKQAADDSELVVFPGVEVTCAGGKSGIHIIVLFDPSKDGGHVVGFLSSLNMLPEEQGQPNALVGEKIGVTGVIEKAIEWQGIAIPAHVNSEKGILCDMRGQQRTRIVQHPQLLAVEATDFHKTEGKRTVDFLDGNDPTYKRKLAVYQASDNRCADEGADGHCLQTIGSRCSYFKMETINLDSLRQCFIDPDVRILQDGESVSRIYPYIKKVTINSGFLDGQTVEFHSGLNSILGSKGAGKSLLVEFMRFGLNQEPSDVQIAEDHAAKLRERLGEYGSVQASVVDETGRDLVIERTFRELDSSPYDESVPYDPAQIFPVLFLSQNEIIRVAENESAQLDFIDRFFDFRGYRAKIRSLERELETLDGSMAEALRAFAEVEELDERIGTLEAEMEKLDAALANPIFERFQELEAKERTLSGQLNHLQEMVESVRRTRGRILDESIAPAVPQALLQDPAVKRNQDLIERAYQNLERGFSDLIDALSSEIDTVNAELNTWMPRYSAGKKDYESHIQEMGSDYQGLAKGRERAERQLTDLRRQRGMFVTKRDRIREISNQRNELLDSIQKAYGQYTAERKAKCEKFQDDSGNKLQLRILDSSNTDEFRNRLLSLKRGSYLREEDINRICDTINPRAFVMGLLRYQASRKSDQLEELATAADIEMNRMITLAEFLLSTIPYEELLALQYKALPKDRPEIKYNVGNGTYQPLSKISVGQKCTAMLIMALSDGAVPIVIDQPEDSLDIRSIWEDMCLRLRVGKEKRQFIFTTHNSSLAVASDTDCFVVMEGTSAQGSVVYSGSMDHDPMNTEVLKYLEGGRKTYAMKFAKYRTQASNNQEHS